jgi:regulatory protein
VARLVVGDGNPASPTQNDAPSPDPADEATPTSGRKAGRGAADRRGARSALGADEDPESFARTICLRLLTLRARSRSELSAALAAKDVPDDVAGKVLDRFAEVGLVDDAAFAQGFADAKRAERGLAAREIARQLRGKGVPDELAANAVSGMDEEAERSMALALVQRKARAMSGLDAQVQTRRLVGLLARKGYSPGLSYSVVREVVRGSDELLPPLSEL